MRKTGAVEVVELGELGERLHRLNPRRFDRVVEKLRVIVEAEEILSEQGNPLATPILVTHKATA